MPNCPKCGSEVREDMAFCPKCGASLKVQPVPATTAPRPAQYRREEKAESREKREKQEKGEKTEKYEKREGGYMGPLIGGLVLIVIGLIASLQMSGMIGAEMVGAAVLILIGIVIILAGIYGAMLASRRHPRT
jgi:uncharacterized Zn finger protein (UPF0148 family)